MSKQLIKEYMDNVWNKKNLSAIREVFAEEAVIHSPLGEFQTQQQMEEVVRKWITALPDLTIRFLHTLEEDGVVVTHWEAQGTHQQELNGLAASGRPVKYCGVSMYRLDGGKVVEYWAYLDSWKALERQIRGE